MVPFIVDLRGLRVSMETPWWMCLQGYVQIILMGDGRPNLEYGWHHFWAVYKRERELNTSICHGLLHDYGYGMTNCLVSLP